MIFNNKLLDKTILIIIYLVFGINLLNFIFSYNNLAADRKINLDSNWYFVLIDIVMIIIILIDYIGGKRKREMFKSVTYKVEDSYRIINFFLKIFICGSIVLNTSVNILHPSFIQLTGSFTMLLLITQISVHFFIESGINDNGISNGGVCYLWSDIDTCTYNQENNFLKITIKNKKTSSKSKKTIDFKLKDVNSDTVLKLINSKIQIQ
ncbi:MAG: hypothetical protein AB6733_23245 [Clostridiaceae bacterium]